MLSRICKQSLRQAPTTDDSNRQLTSLGVDDELLIISGKASPVLDLDLGNHSEIEFRNLVAG